MKGTKALNPIHSFGGWTCDVFKAWLSHSHLCMTFTLPGVFPWTFRIVLIGQQIVLEATSDGQRLSKLLDPASSRIRSGYDLIETPQCALINAPSLV